MSGREACCGLLPWRIVMRELSIDIVGIRVGVPAGHAAGSGVWPGSTLSHAVVGTKAA